MSRRGGRQSRRGVGASLGGGAAAPAGPPDIASLTAWIRATDAGNTYADGADVTSLADAIAAGNWVTRTASSEPTWEEDAWGRDEPSGCLLFDVGDWQADGTLAATISALLNGTDLSVSVAMVYQRSFFASVTPYFWGFGRVAGTTDYLACRNNEGSDQALSTVERYAGPAAEVLVDGVYDSCGPTLSVISRDGSEIVFETDGVETARTETVDAIQIDQFVFGAWPAGTAQAAGGRCKLKHLMVFSEKISANAAAKAELKSWVATNVPELAWKSGLGGTAGGASDPIVIAVLGQSNGDGRGEIGYSPAGTRLFGLYRDGFRGALTEPTGDKANGVYRQASNQGTSAWGRLADAIRAGGYDGDIYIVNACDGGTSSDTWAADVGASPTRVGNTLGTAKLMTHEALKAPGSKLFTIVFQGESDASPANYVEDAWHDNWDAICSDWVTEFSSRHVDAATRFIVVRLHSSINGAGFTHYDDIQAEQDTLVGTTRSDCVSVQADDGTLDSGLHLDTGSNSPGSETELMKLGVDCAAQILTVLGL